MINSNIPQSPLVKVIESIDIEAKPLLSPLRGANPNYFINNYFINEF